MQVELLVDGMTCGHCTSTVARALEAEAGVARVDVSLERESAEVEFDPNTTSPGALAEAIEAVGFAAREAPPRGAVRLRVDGMTCGHCTSAVERALAAEAGVLRATVALLDGGRADVEYDPAVTSPAALADAVEAVGFGAAPERGAPPPAPDGGGGAPIKLHVAPMVCGHCVTWVTDALQRVDGVARVEIDLEEQSALVFAADGARLVARALVEATSAAGYRAAAWDDEAAAQRAPRPPAIEVVVDELEDEPPGTPGSSAPLLSGDDDAMRARDDAGLSGREEVSSAVVALRVGDDSQAPCSMTQVVALHVGGMSCAACALRVQGALERVPGVESATVNALAERAIVRLVSDAASAVAPASPPPRVRLRKRSAAADREQSAPEPERGARADGDDEAVARALCAVVEQLGYTAARAKTTPPGRGEAEVVVGGMVCSSCPLRIEAALGRRFGQITRVSASLVSGRVTVQWDAASPLQARDLLGPRTLLEAVEALGCRDLFSRTCECLENRADEKPSDSLRKGTARRSPSTRASRARSPTRARRRGARSRRGAASSSSRSRSRRRSSSCRWCSATCPPSTPRSCATRSAGARARAAARFRCSRCSRGRSRRPCSSATVGASTARRTARSATARPTWTSSSLSARARPTFTRSPSAWSPL